MQTKKSIDELKDRLYSFLFKRQVDSIWIEYIIVVLTLIVFAAFFKCTTNLYLLKVKTI